MATYTSLNALYKGIGKQAEKALNKTANDVVERATDLIWERYYKLYHPKEYVRTYQLLNSVMRSKVSLSGDTYSVEIYLDPTGVQYATQDVLSVFLLASEGFHGSKDIETEGKFFKELVDEVMANYKSYLIKHGLNVI